MWIAPSEKTIDRDLKLDCTGADIRAIWKARTTAELFKKYPPIQDHARRMHLNAGPITLKRLAVNMAGNFYGVEYIGRCKRSGQSVYYCNAGDAYAATLIFKGKRLTVGCWGDLIESGAIDTGNPY